MEELGVGPMPLWIDRFARTLHGGRDAVRHAGVGTGTVLGNPGFFCNGKLSFTENPSKMGGTTKI